MMKKVISPLLCLWLTACAVSPALLSTQVRTQAKPKTLQIRLFRSYGNEQQIHLKARVMKAENLRPESPNDWAIINFWRNLMSLSVKESANIKVDFSLNGKTQRLSSDEEGMIQIPTQSFGPLGPGVHTLQAEIVPGQNVQAAISKEKIIIQAQTDPNLGIVSDIDDTIKISSVTNKWKALRRLLFNNSYTSEPIPGTSVLYQRLESKDQLQDGDVSYISGSPINLAETIYRFMDHRQFPIGAIELKKWGFGAGDDSPLAQQSFKLTRLRQLFNTYPQKSFLLFGDSGEKDPEIYRQIASEFPERVKGIFINNVTQSHPTDPRFQGVYLTQSVLDAAQILYQQGFLTALDFEAVKQATQITKR